MTSSFEFVENPDGEVLRIAARGTDVLGNALINRGTAFTTAEREALDLTGLLPSQVVDIEDQLRRVYSQYRAQPDALSKYLFLTAMHDRNEVLYFRLLGEHIEEMLPIVYTPTIGEAIERFSHEYVGTRGVFLSIDHPERIEESLTKAGHAGMRPIYAGRDASASPATGLASRHKAQQEALVAAALGL